MLKNLRSNVWSVLFDGICVIIGVISILLYAQHSLQNLLISFVYMLGMATLIAAGIYFAFYRGRQPFPIKNALALGVYVVGIYAIIGIYLLTQGARW